MPGDVLDQVSDDARVDLEQVVPRHPRLARDARGNDDDINARQTLRKLRVAREVLHPHRRVDMRQVGGDARRRSDVVELEGGDARRERGRRLDEERQRLTDAPRSAQHGDRHGAWRRGRVMFRQHVVAVRVVLGRRARRCELTAQDRKSLGGL